MAGLSELVEAATEGMRKTQSADPIEENSNQPPPPTKDDGHLSDSAVAPTRERKKGELFFPGNLPRFVRFLPKPPLRIWSARDSASESPRLVSFSSSSVRTFLSASIAAERRTFMSGED